MKAVVLTANRRLEFSEVTLPEPEPFECLIAVQAAGVCSSDVPRAFDGGAYFYPLIMGHEFAGEVVRCGREAAQRFQPGDRVGVFPLIPCQRCPACADAQYARCRHYDYYGSRRHGGFAEYVNVSGWNLVPLPAGVGIQDAALLEPLAVVIHALRTGGLLGSAGPTRLLVLGGGFLGLLAAQVMRLRQPEVSVTLVDRNRHKLEIAERSGAATVCLPDDAAWDQWLGEQAGAWELVLEASGSPAVYRRAVELAAAGGTVVWMGNISGDLTLPKATVSSILRRELRVLGTWNSTYHPERPSDWTVALDLIAQGLRPSGLVSHHVELPGLSDTLAAASQQRSGGAQHRILKILASPRAAGPPASAS